MAKNEKIINGKKYKVVSAVIGHKINEAGNEVPVKKVFYGSTMKEARTKRDEYIKQIESNLDTKNQYFGIVADRWLYNFLALDDSIAVRTKALYINSWNKYLKPTNLYSMPLNNITAGTLQTLFNSLYKNGVPSSALNNIRKTLKRFYKYLVQNGLAPFNFIDTISVPKGKKKQGKNIVVWNDEELSKIINGFNKAQNGFRLRFLVIMGIYTGMRISEVLGLKYSDIQKTEAGYIVKVQRQVTNIETFDTDGTKTTALGITELKTTCSYREIPLPAIVIDELNKHKAWHRVEQMKNGYRTEFIFTTNSGGFVDSKNTRTALNRYYKIIGVPAKGFHTYRHTFGTNLYKNGVPIVTASRLMGHDDISTTQKYYIDIHEEDKRRAIELLASVI